MKYEILYNPANPKNWINPMSPYYKGPSSTDSEETGNEEEGKETKAITDLPNVPPNETFQNVTLISVSLFIVVLISIAVSMSPNDT